MIDKKIITALSLMAVFVSAIIFVNVVGIEGTDAEASPTFTADNGIVYSLDDTKLTATVSDGKKCIGDIVIPSSIFVDGKNIML